MGIKEFDIMPGLKCSVCGTEEDVTIDENGEEICTDCLFEQECEDMDYLKHPDEDRHAGERLIKEDFWPETGLEGTIFDNSDDGRFID